MIFQPRQFEVGGTQIHLAGNDEQPVKNGRLNFFEQAALAEQHLIGAGAFNFFHADAAGGVGLRVEIEQQNVFPDGSEAGGEIDSSGGFSHTTFLVGDGDDFGWHCRN